MPALLQVCIVVVTVVLLASALLALRAITRFLDKAAEDISRLAHAVRDSAAQVDRVTDDAGALVASLRDCVPPLMRVVDRFEVLGQRTADLSSTLLDELERPVLTAAAVARGVRSGADHFLKRLTYRLTRHHTPIHGGQDHE